MASLQGWPLLDGGYQTLAPGMFHTEARQDSASAVYQTHNFPPGEQRKKAKPCKTE